MQTAVLDLVATRATQTAKKTFNYNLEALRGLAALLVIWHHTTHTDNILDPHYTQRGIAAFSPSGHVAVLIFFLLSGYVIEFSTKAPLKGGDVAVYLKKRFARIYPIYLATLLFTLAVGVYHYSWQTLLANFTLTQVALSKVIFEVNPIWSLNYEVLFYLLFIPLSYFRIPPIWAAGVAFCIGLVNLLLGAHAPLLTSYMFGFTFWLAGAAVARHFRNHPTHQVTYTQLLGALCLLVGLYYFNVLLTVLTKVENSSHGLLLYPAGTPWVVSAITFQDFAFLPYCVFILLLFAAKEYKYRRVFAAVLMLLPLYTFRYLAHSYGVKDLSLWVIPTLCYLLSLVFYLLPTSAEAVARPLIKLLIRAGSISYGLYIIHFPLFYIFMRIEAFSGTPITWIGRLVCYSAMCLGAAYWLEKVYQPRVRHWLGW
jgi:peptidoglycan/LPS O-acetylase OafA/YrhL